MVESGPFLVGATRMRNRFSKRGTHVIGPKVMTEVEEKALRSTDLLEPPTGPGAAFLLKELKRKGESKVRGPPRTFPVGESTGGRAEGLGTRLTMARARLLLPLLAAAEKDLRRRMDSGPKGCVDIENVGEDEPHIEMDLAVVPLSAQDDEAIESSSESEEEGEEEEEDDSEEGTEMGNEEEELTSFPLRLPNRRRKRHVRIEELPSK